jgi:hypothetical protein
MFHETSVNTPHKNIHCQEGEALNIQISMLHARSEVNQMWILKYSSELLEA